MKIKEFGRNKDVAVLAMYWAEYRGKNQRLYMVVPYAGYEGLITVSEDECELTDPSIDGYRLTKAYSNGAVMGDLIVLAVIQDHGLLDRMIDHEPEAIAEFNGLMRVHAST